MKLSILALISTLFIGCVLDTEKDSNVQINSTSQSCRDFKNCDGSEASTVYSVSLVNGETFEVSKNVYYACSPNDFYPSCSITK